MLSTTLVIVAAALLLSSSSSSTDAFSPPLPSLVPSFATDNNAIRFPREDDDRRSSRYRQLLPRHFLAMAVLQPGKKGIIVEAKSDYVAKDALIDAFMGRSTSSSSFGGDKGGNISSGQGGEHEDSWLSPSSSMSSAQRSGRSSRGNNSSPGSRAGMGAQSNSMNPMQTMTKGKSFEERRMMDQQSQHSQQQQRQQRLQPRPPPPPSSISPPKDEEDTTIIDPSSMTLSDICSELTLQYQTSYNDCFDRISLEERLRLVRDQHQQQQLGNDNGNDSNDVSSSGEMTTMNTDTIPSFSSTYFPPPTVTANRPAATTTTTQQRRRRASPAEQAVFTTRVSAASSRTAHASSATTLRTSSSTKSTPSTHNSNNNYNSRTSFRDSAKGIGFGDANCYIGAGASSGGGDGVRLGKQRTSYGDFGSVGVGDSSNNNNNKESNNAIIGRNANGWNSGDRNEAPSSERGSNGGGGGGCNNYGSIVGFGSSSSSSTSTFNTGGGNYNGGSDIISSAMKTSTFSTSGGGGGGGSTTTFSSGGNSPSFGREEPRRNFGPSSSSSFATNIGGGRGGIGGISINGDSSMFSNAGFVGQQQQMQQRPPQNPNTTTSTSMSPSTSVMGKTQLDRLLQDKPVSNVGGGFEYHKEDNPNTPPAWFGNANGYYDDNIIPDNDSKNDNDVDEDESNDNVHHNRRLGIMSQQYQQKGLDMLSGGLDGFGAVKGIEKASGDMNHRVSASDVKVPGGGVVGNVGVTMGGDFNSSSNVGNGPRRSSARYSFGGEYGD